MYEKVIVLRRGFFVHGWVKARLYALSTSPFAVWDSIQTILNGTKNCPVDGMCKRGLNAALCKTEVLGPIHDKRKQKQERKEQARRIKE